MLPLSGFKSYIAAIGLIVVAIQQFNGGDYTGGLQSMLAALATIGLRSAISTTVAPVAAMAARYQRDAQREAP